MSAQPDVHPRRRRRRWPWVVGIVVLLLVAIVWLLSRLLDAQRVTAFFLEQIRERTGWTVQLAAPAKLSLFPDLHVEIAGLAATAPGADRPMLTAQSADVVLPWRALVDRELVLGGLRVQQPVFNYEAFSRWRATLPDDDEPTPIELPRLEAPVVIRGGIVAAAGWRITDLDVDASALLAQQRFEGSASGTYITRADDGSESATRVALTLATTPGSDGAAVALSDLLVSIAYGDLPPYALRGEATLAPQTLRLSLSGDDLAWPAAWPALPATGADDASGIHVALDYDGGYALDGEATITLSRGELGANATLRPGRVLAWLQSEAASPLPPVAGEASLPRLDIGGATLEGIELRIRDDEATPDADDGPAP